MTGIGSRPADGCNHQEFQACVVKASNAFGWSHLSVRRAMARGAGWQTTTNRKGWPDLFLWHPRWGFAAIELKIKPDKARPDQLACLAELAAAGAVRMVAYPADWEDVLRLLAGRRGVT